MYQQEKPIYCVCGHRKSDHQMGSGTCYMDNGREFDPCFCTVFRQAPDQKGWQKHEESLRQIAILADKSRPDWY